MGSQGTLLSPKLETRADPEIHNLLKQKLLREPVPGEGDLSDKLAGVNTPKRENLQGHPGDPPGAPRGPCPGDKIFLQQPDQVLIVNLGIQ